MVRLDKIIYMITCFKSVSQTPEQFDYSTPNPKTTLDDSSIKMIKRVGVIPNNKETNTYLNFFYNSIPYGRENFLVENMNRYSQKVCKDKSPVCSTCTISNHCDYHNKKNDWKIE